MNRKKQVILITNILTPYRMITYDKLYETFQEYGYEFKVYVMSDGEPNRKWKYVQYKRKYTNLLEKSKLKISDYNHNNKVLRKSISLQNVKFIILSGTYLAITNWKMIFLAKGKIPIIYWSESHLDEQRSYNKIKLLVRECIRKIFYNMMDGFIFVGKKSLEFIRNYNKDAKCFYLPNIVDDQIFSNSKTANKHNDKFTFILPARLEKEKGIDEFLDLIQGINTSLYRIICPGEGSLKEKLQKKAREYNIDLQLVGYKTQEEMIELYKIADGFCLPSLSDPNPLSCIEALWQGLPLFISNHVGNYPEVIEQENNGYVFSYHKKEEAREDFRKMITSSQDWRNKAQEISINKAKDNFTPQKVVERLVRSINTFLH